MLVPPGGLRAFGMQGGWCGAVWLGKDSLSESCTWPAWQSSGNVMQEYVKSVPFAVMMQVVCITFFSFLTMDAGNSTRLLLRGETCLEMENMVYYSCFLQRCLVGLLDAGLNSERRCTDTMAESL